MDWNVAFDLLKAPSGSGTLFTLRWRDCLFNGLLIFLEEGPIVSAQQFNRRIVVLRNICCGDNLLSASLRDFPAIFEEMLMLCRFVALAGNSETFADDLVENASEMFSFLNKYSDQDLKTLIRIITQFFSNFVASSLMNARFFFRKYLSDTNGSKGNLKDALAAAIVKKEAKAVHACWMCFYTIFNQYQNCVSSSTENEVLQWITQTVCGKQLLRQLILGIQSTISSETTNISEICQLFCVKLMETQKVYQVYSSFEKFSMEQSIFLFTFTRTLELLIQEKNIQCNLFEYSDMIMFMRQVSVQLESILRQVMDECNEILQEKHSAHNNDRNEQSQQPINRNLNNNSSLDAKDRLLLCKLHREFTLASLSMLCQSLSLLQTVSNMPVDINSPTSPLINLQEIQAELGHILLTSFISFVLIDRDPVSRRTFITQIRNANATAAIDLEEDLDILFEREVVRNVLQVTAMICYQSLANALLLLHHPTERAIPTLLQYCVTDFTNPLTREWALLVIRNLCECSDEIVETVKSLKPQKLWQETVDETVQNLQVDVSLDIEKEKLILQRREEK
jgi:hypothetical protein